MIHGTHPKPLSFTLAAIRSVEVDVGHGVVVGNSAAWNGEGGRTSYASFSLVSWFVFGC